MIQVTDLHYTYVSKKAVVEALSGINLSISEGEFVAIVGPNSSGKTTLARHLNGLLLPSRGQVLVDNLDTRDARNLLPIRQLVGMVLSNPDNQIVGTVVEEDVAFGLENLQTPQDVMRPRVDESLEMTELKNERKRNPRHLSNGQKQLLALAGILAMRPKYLVFDEVTSMLDPKMQKAVLGLTTRLRNVHGKAIIWVTHRLDEVLYADRVVVMNQGRIFLEGSPHEIFAHKEQLQGIGLDVPALVTLALDLQRLGLIDQMEDFSVKGIVEGLCG